MSDSEREEHPRSGNERLARLEQDTKYIRKGQEDMHKDLRAHMEEERENYRLQEKRISAIETEQARVKTHLSWMKGIWIAVQGVVLGWLGLK